MSLQRMTKITTAIVRRVVVSQGSAMGQQRSYTTAGRGALPTTSTGRLNQDAATRRFVYQEHDSQVDGVWFTTTNPQCGDNAQDQLVIGTDLWFVQWQKNPDQVSKYFMLGLKKYGRGVQ